MEGVALPAEDVVAVLAVAGSFFGGSVSDDYGMDGDVWSLRVAVAEDKGLGAVGGPVFFFVECRGVPYDLWVGGVSLLVGEGHCLDARAVIIPRDGPGGS